ncbi:acyl-ACP desaturase [Streptomyces sp. NPDC087300]|uniref:acyl-ACP desaturase n=1 Tax=Streptomyces sp. NPDC087300 TaxID=3365780 RepID=UPI0037F41C7A
MSIDLLVELEPVVEENLNRHLSIAKEWMPHRYVPWGRGQDFAETEEAELEAWDPDKSPLSAEVRAALEVNLLTEDNLPSYHHEIATRFGREGPWGTWVHRWTAEEGRHATAIRDYLVVTRSVDPDELERRRIAVMEAGYDGGDRTIHETIAYVALQELATRVAHRNTGRRTGDPVADRLLSRVAADENLHMVFYRSLVDAALAIDPSAMVRAICREVMAFEMPGAQIPGFRRKAIAIARADIYNLGVHGNDILGPLLRHWRIFDLPGLDASAEALRSELAVFTAQLQVDAERQAERFAKAAHR